ncbi:MAG TPA: glutamine cyclotransferase [Polyangia bacterium]|nr:glutamine cyclotransferase [Polyangia bacterium]
MTRSAKSVTAQPAEIVREYGPLPGVEHVAGVTFDGRQVWIACGDRLNALDPDSGTIVRSIEAPGDAGTAFDGRHLWQLAGGRIQQIEVETGQVLKTLAPAIEGNPSGMAWAEGTLWVGDYGGGKIHQIDPESGAVLRAIESDRFVTGVSWIEGELWHGTGAGPDGPAEVRRIDPKSGAVEASLVFPDGAIVSGLEGVGPDLLFCGGGKSGKLRSVRRPRRKAGKAA